MIYDMTLALIWYLTLTAFGVIVLPVSMIVFRRMPEGGILLSRPLGWLLLGAIPWLLGWIGLPFTAWSIALVGLGLFAVSFQLFRSRTLWLRNRLRFHWRTARNGEILTILVFLLFIWIRRYDPAIDSTEKPMDAMLYSALAVGREIPPQDLWFAGQTVNYHYGGYLLNAIPAKLTGIPTEYAYNLSIAAVAAIATSVAFVLGRALFGRCRWAPITVLCTLFVGNLAAFFNHWKYEGWRLSFFNWRWDYLFHTSRIITDPDGETINEYPFFSLLWGDLHPHFSDIPFFLFFLALTYVLGRTLWQYPARRVVKYLWPNLAVTLLAGALLLPTNIFDFPVASLFYGFVMLAVIVHRWVEGKWTAGDLGLLVALGSLPIWAYLLAAPFWLNFVSPLTGPPLQWVPHRSGLYGFLLIFGAHALCTLLVLGVIASKWFVPRTYEEKGFLGALLGILAVALWAITGYVTFPLILCTSLAVWGVLVYHVAQRPQTPWQSCRQYREAYAWIAVALAWSLIAGCEFVYLPDNYAAKRMNTLFKFHFPAWMLFGIGLPFVIHLTLQRWENRRGRLAVSAAVLGVFLLSILGPVFLLVTFFLNTDFSSPASGEAFAALQTAQPLLHSAVAWVRNSVWLLLGLGLILVLFSSLRLWQRQSRKRVAALAVSLVLLLLFFQLDSLLLRFFAQRGDSPFPTLNGLVTVQKAQPHLYEIIQWVRENTSPGDRILEIPGCGYRQESFVSAFTGRPSMMGWVNHEMVWRPDNNPIFHRKDEVLGFLTNANWEEAKQYLKENRVRYVILAQPECEDNTKQLDRMQQGAFRQHLEPVMQEKGNPGNPNAPYELYRVPENL